MSNVRTIQATSSLDDKDKGSKLARPFILQHFETAVMTAVSSLESKSSPAEITRHLCVSLGRHVSLAQVFIALERLEDKGYLKSRIAEKESVPGGRRRRIFEVEASGAQALVKAATLHRMASASPNEAKHVHATAPT